MQTYAKLIMRDRQLAFIGAGVVSLSVAQAFKSVGFECVIGSRDIDKAKAACRQYKLSLTVTDYTKAVTNADVVFLGVPDDAIAKVAEALIKDHNLHENRKLIHFSGALGSDILKRAEHNLSVASAHPLQTFPSVDAGLNTLKNTFWFCEGDEIALSFLETAMPQISHRYTVIDSSAKTLYHLSAVFACNYLTSLMELSLVCAENSGLNRSEMFEALKPLITSTLENTEKSDTTNALTGPIARGDINTIRKHLDAISADKNLFSNYKELGKIAIQLSRNKGLANKNDLLAIEKLLEEN
jgi:predicted short-subunit dehydrogenase-like oxidoreductase (DUF2520 family)